MAGSDDRHTYAPGALLPGTPYKIERRLGAGGMGVVYMVRHTFLNRLEALKTIHPELVDRRDIAERMQKEAEVVAKLRHPNIVQVTGGGIIEDEWRLPYFAMELLRGKNLRQVLKKRTLADVASIYSVATEVLGALAEAHAHRVVHRDVKPENIFLQLDATRSAGPKITTKLLDFGIVAVLGGRQSMSFRGTYKYASPEQLRGEKVSQQTDIYSMGLVLYEMIAGRGPFEDRDVKELVKAHLEREAPRLSTFVEVPRAIDDLLARVLEKDPVKRPATAMVFAQELFVLKQLSENRPIVLAARTEETLLTTIAEQTGDHRDPQGTSNEPTKPDAPARTPVVSSEEDETSEGPIPYALLLQGGTLENAEPPSAKSTRGSPFPLAFEKTDLDRRAVTRTADPAPVAAPRYGTEPITPPESDPRYSDQRYVDLETFLAEEGENSDAWRAQGSSPLQRDLTGTPPPVSRLRSFSDPNATPARMAATKGRVLRGIFVGAVLLVAGALGWVRLGASSRSPAVANVRAASAPTSAPSVIPVKEEPPADPPAPAFSSVASIASQASPASPRSSVVDNADTARRVRALAKPLTSALAFRASTAAPVSPSGRGASPTNPTPPPLVRPSEPAPDSELKRTIVR